MAKVHKIKIDMAYNRGWNAWKGEAVPSKANPYAHGDQHDSWERGRLAAILDDDANTDMMGLNE